MKEKLVVVLIFSAVGIREFWTLLPNTLHTFDPFPLYDIQITKQTYVAFACYHVSMLILAFAFSKLFDTMRSVAMVWFHLQLIEFVDYFLTYNTTGITYVKLFTLFTYSFYKICKI